MGKILFAVDNLIDGAALAGGNWSAGLPSSNFADPQPSEYPARSAGLAPGDALVEADWSEERTVNLVALIQPRPRPFITQEAEWRVLLDGPAGDFSAPRHDFGWQQMWPSVVPFGIGEWGEFLWGGKLPPEEAERYGILSRLLAEPGVRASKLRLEISDPANPAGYTGGGRLFAGAALRPARNVAAGWRLVPGHEDVHERVPSGTLHSRASGTWRRIEFTLRYMSRDEALGYFFDQLALRRGRQVIVSLDPEDAVHGHRLTVYGVVPDPVEFEDMPGFPGRMTARFIVEEMP